MNVNNFFKKDILKRFEKTGNEDLEYIGSPNKDVNDVLKKHLNFCDNPKDFFNYLIKLLEEEVSNLKTIKDEKSNSYFEQYSICNAIYYLLRPITKITYSGGKNSKPINENVEKRKNNIKKVIYNKFRILKMMVRISCAMFALNLSLTDKH